MVSHKVAAAFIEFFRFAQRVSLFPFILDAHGGDLVLQVVHLLVNELVFILKQLYVPCQLLHVLDRH